MIGFQLQMVATSSRGFQAIDIVSKPWIDQSRTLQGQPANFAEEGAPSREN